MSTWLSFFINLHHYTGITNFEGEDCEARLRNELEFLNHMEDCNFLFEILAKKYICLRITN